MDKLAIWIGLFQAVNHTGKMAWFKYANKKRDLVLIAHKYEWKPWIDREQFHMVLSHAIKQGATFTISKVKVRTSKFMNIKAVMELDGKIITHLSSSYQTSIIICLSKYVDNIYDQIT
jgi:hypothetical protein